MAEDRVSTPEEISQASAEGWKDNKDHPNYKEAWQFLEDGKKIAPIAAKKNARLEAELTAMRQSFNELRDDLIKERIAGEKAGYEKAKNELARRKAKALQDEDIDALKEIDREERDLKPPKVEDRKETKEPPPKEFFEWRERNEWYGDHTDELHYEMTLYADSIGPAIAEKSPKGTPLDKVYADIENKVKKRFPEAFGEKETPTASVETGGHRAPKSNNGKQNWANLPKDIRDEAEQRGYVKKYFNGDKEKYAESAWKTLNLGA